MPRPKSVEPIIHSRSSVNLQLIRIFNYAQDFEEGDNIQQIESRYEKLHGIWEKYDELQSKLEAIDCELYQDDRVQFETQYYDTVAEIKRIISKHKLATATVQQVITTEQHVHQPRVESNNLSSRINLPKMNLPQFNGDYREWRCFYDLFRAVIHDNTTISNIEKLFYLKASLSGEASKIIDSIPPTSENYETAFKLLIERYDNNQLIINAHLSNLFALSNILKQSASALRTLITEAKQQIESLKALKLPVEHWDVILIHVLAQKLDYASRKEWELQRSKNQLPKLSEFFSFLETRCSSLEALETPSMNKPSINSFNKPRGKTTQVMALTTDQATATCHLCNSNHRLYRCDKFHALNVNDRINAVQTARVCFNCLNPGHSVKQCTATRCKKCNKPHSTFIHYEQNRNPESGVKASQHAASAKDTVACSNFSQPKQTLLSTAIVRVQNKAGAWINCRALLDSGSQSNCVTNNLINQLNLSKTKRESNLLGIDGTNTQVNYSVQLTISSRVKNYQVKLECLVLNKIVTELPIEHIDVSTWNLPETSELADPSFNEPGQIDLLIGAEIYFKILIMGQKQAGDNLPNLQYSKFGWMVSGNIVNHKTSTNASYTLLSTVSPSTDELLMKFWELENFPKKTIRSREENEREDHFQKTIQRNESGRYIAQLPLRNEKLNLIGNSRRFAEQRLEYLWRRLSSNQKLYDQYTEFMQEYLELDHMELFDESKTVLPTNGYYIPHHAVFKETNSGNKLRVVFDASKKSDTGVSLNDALKVGPVIQQDLLTIVLKFRLHKYVLIADIQKMYRQILIQNDHQKYQLILWKNQPNEEIKTYKLKTVTYGTASAPYIATKCIQHLATTDGENYPLAKTALLNSCYVDDIMTGTDSIPEALEMQRQLIELLSKGGFILHKWSANHTELLKNIEVNQREHMQSLEIGKDVIKTLGLLWAPSRDKFKFVIKLKDNSSSTITKRSILSDIAGIFDPLGLLGPIVVKAKIFLQELWKLKISWDDQVPENLTTEWLNFRSRMQQIRDFEIERTIINIEPINLQYEIHGFADASQVAYGACLYLKVTNERGEVSVNLITAKSRVAPIKPTTIPRLELCAALTLTRLLDKVLLSLQLKEVSIHLFTDSSITLNWILSDASSYKTFVGNRVLEIQELSKECTWHHVSTNQNPADLLSRGMKPTELQDSELWWNGPSWLQLREAHWPKTNILKQQQIDVELKPKRVITLTSIEKSEFLRKYSSLFRLQRVTAYIRRFAHNTKKIFSNNKLTDMLSTQELQDALMCLIKIAQHEEFQDELELLNNNKEVNRGHLKPLMPFLDEQGILRVGGRLQNSLRDYEYKHQIILPKNHHLTILLIQNEHKRLLHAGTQAVLASIRLHYWPIHARSVVRKVIHQCITCYRHAAKPGTQIMGNLPACRVQPFRAFLNTGVDYGGPILVKTGNRRNSPLIKTYIALFVCLSTRAIHVELVTSLTTQSFMGAFKRFISRRGVCRTIHCDNATNFKGAEREMTELYDLFHNQITKTTIINEAATLGVQWKFIPPNAPHFGGLWEAGIKSVKYHLKRVMGTLTLTFEETYTILAQIEACVNSRPICKLSDDPSDPTILTPAHFLIGCPITAMPEPDLLEVEETRLSRWQRMQTQVQLFWKGWSRDYLNTLQQRSKWTNSTPNLKTDDIVLIKTDNQPPLHWPMGRVTEVHPGPDGRVRVATITTSAGTYTRPITKLCRLPLSTNESF